MGLVKQRAIDVSLRLTTLEHERVLALGNSTRVTAAVDAAGNDLTPEPDEARGSSTRHYWRLGVSPSHMPDAGKPALNDLSLQVPIRTPEPPRGLARVEGEFTAVIGAAVKVTDLSHSQTEVWTEIGPGIEARVTRLSQSGHSVEVDLAYRGDHRNAYEFGGWVSDDGDAHRRLPSALVKSVSFVFADGTEVSDSGSTMLAAPTRVSVLLPGPRSKAAEVTAVRVRVVTDVKETQVPFALADIPVPAIVEPESGTD